MFFLKRAFGGGWVPIPIAVLLCLYGSEIYQFKVVVDTLVVSFGTDRLITVIALTGLIVYAVIGGVSRVSKVSSWCMPIFLLGYIGMCLSVIASHYELLPTLLKEVLTFSL